MLLFHIVQLPKMKSYRKKNHHWLFQSHDIVPSTLEVWAFATGLLLFVEIIQSSVGESNSDMTVYLH